MPSTNGKGSSVDALVAAIRDDIVAGRLSPGQRINQDEWAERMSLSRTPVRLALERLEAEGFIKLLPRRGAVVVEMTTSYLEDILSARLVLESSLGRAGAGNLTAQDLDELAATYHEIQAIPLPEGHHSLLVPAHRFHERLFQASATPVMYRYAMQVIDHSHVFLNHYWYANRRIAQVTKLYFAELIEACRNADLDRVETVMRGQRVELAGVILRERARMDQLRVLPSLLSGAELSRLHALVESGDEPTGPSKPTGTPPHVANRAGLTGR